MRLPPANKGAFVRTGEVGAPGAVGGSVEGRSHHGKLYEVFKKLKTRDRVIRQPHF